MTNPNGTTVTNAYDNASRLTSVTNKNSGATTLSSFSYAYNVNGEKMGVTEADGSTVAWTYDAHRRVTGETRTGTYAYSKSYTLDAEGNRTGQTAGGVTTTFTLNADDELTATSGGFANAYTYDLAGQQTQRTLSGTTYNLTYDYEGQLTGIATGASVTYEYDALGRRVSRSAGGTTTTFHYAGDSVLLEKQGSTTLASNTWGNGLVRRGSEYPLMDGQGNERTVTNASQTVTGAISFDSFGNAAGSTGSSSSPYMYQANSGYRTEGDAGLAHVGARFYDAQVGRFVTRDTVLTERPYLYCEHDPVNFSDPSGHDKEPTPGLLGRLWKVGNKIVGTGLAVLSGIKIYEKAHIALIDMNTTHEMRRMINEWQPRNPDQDYEPVRRSLQIQQGRALKSTSDAGGEAYKGIYK